MPNCANCGAPMRLESSSGALVCAHCGTRDEWSRIVRGITIGRQTPLVCPTCVTALSEARLDGWPLLICQGCLGMLIEMSYFVSVIDAARDREAPPSDRVPPRDQRPGERVLNCPRCAQPMLSHAYAGPGNVVIDTCEPCLVNWLDPGELRRIARAPDTRRPKDQPDD